MTSPPLLPGQTRVGMPPVHRAPATANHIIPTLYSPTLPDLVALASDPGAYEDAVLDMSANALRIADDRDALAASQPHLEAVCKLLEDRDRQLVSAQADVAAARQERDAYRRALAQEQADKAAHVRGLEAEILRLKQLNVKRCEDADRARRLSLLMMQQHASVLSELIEHDAEVAAAERPVPPSHDDFGSAPVFLARGTNPENETFVVDVPLSGGAL